MPNNRFQGLGAAVRAAEEEDEAPVPKTRAAVVPAAVAVSSRPARTLGKRSRTDHVAVKLLLPAGLHEELKIRAIRQHTDMSEIVAALLRENFHAN